MRKVRGGSQGESDDVGVLFVIVTASPLIAMGYFFGGYDIDDKNQQ